MITNSTITLPPKIKQQVVQENIKKEKRDFMDETDENEKFKLFIELSNFFKSRNTDAALSFEVLLGFALNMGAYLEISFSDLILSIIFQIDRSEEIYNQMQNKFKDLMNELLEEMNKEKEIL